MATAPEAVLTFFPESSLVEIRQQFQSSPKTGGGARGGITGFSRQSRRRLMNLLNTVTQKAWRNQAKMVTLTYHKNQRDHAEAKYHLKRFLQEIKRYDSNYSGVWKLEYQERGAIHFHVLLFGPFLDHSYVSQLWTRIAEPGNHSHRSAGTEIRSVRNARNCAAYFSKYFSKIIEPRRDTPGEPRDQTRGLYDDGTTDYRGRFWGVFNRRYLPVGSATSLVMSGAAASKATKFYSARFKLGGNTKSVIRIYTNGGAKQRAIIDHIKSFEDGNDNPT